MPQITVIVPVYKVEPYLHRCIDSILGQTYPDFELILVDDGSPDNCGAICDEYAAKDSRIVVIHQQNGGLSAARNAGLDWMFASSDSRWLTFIDSDDWVHPQYLEILLRAAEELGADVSMGLSLQTARHDEEFPEIMEKITIREPEPLWVEYNMESMVAWAKLLRRDIFRELRFPEGKIYEDLYTTYQYFFAHSKIALVEEKIYGYFQRSDSIIHESWSRRKLDVIEGQNNALRFFRRNHFEKAERLHLGVYMRNLAAQCWAVQKLPDAQAHQEVLRRLRRNLRRVLVRLHKYQHLPIRENAGIYNEAFPFSMWLYWNVYGIVQRFRSEGLWSVIKRMMRRLHGR